MLAICGLYKGMKHEGGGIGWQVEFTNNHGLLSGAYQMCKDFITNDLDHLKRLLRSDRIDQHVPVDTNGVPGVQDAVLILKNDSPGRRQDQYLVMKRGE